MIQCTNFKSHVKGHLQGFADLYIEKWGVEIQGFTLWMKGGKRWINPPGSTYTDSDGKTKNKAFFYFRNKDQWPIFVEEAKKSIDKWCNENAKQEKQKNFELEFDDSECPF